MDRKRRNPNSQPSSPLPSWLKNDTPRRGRSRWEEDVTLQELYQWEEVRVREPSQRRSRRPRELYKFEEDVRVRERSQWRGGRHPELYQWEERVRRQELHEWEEDGVRYHELTQWEEHVTVQELPQREDVSAKELSQGGADVGHSTWDKPLSPVTAGDSQPVAQEGPSSPSSVGTQGPAEAARDLPSPAPAPLSPTEAEPAAAAPAGAAEEEEPQGPLVPQEAKAEGSPASGELVPSAGPESPVPAPQSPSEGSQALLDTDLQITTEILSRAEIEIHGSEQQLEEQGDLERTKAAEMRETAAGIDSPGLVPQIPSEGNQAMLDMPKLITAEVLRKAELVIQGSEQQLMEQGDQEQSTAAAMVTTGTLERTESLDSLPHSPCCHFSPMFVYVEAKALSGQQGVGEGRALLAFQEIEGGAVLAIQEIEEGVFAEDENNWKFYDELELCRQQDEKEDKSYQWEDGIGQELSEEEECSGRELSEGEVKRHSEQSQCGHGSDRELSLENCEHVAAHNTQVKHLHPEEDEWEELGVLELPQGEGTEHRLGILAEEGLPVPVPREAWAERRAPAPCPAGLVGASPAQLEAQAPRGAAAPPAADKQLAEVGTQTRVPREHPCWFIRALGALHQLFLSCTQGQPED